MVYPAYVALFLKVGELQPNWQPLVPLVQVVIKFLLHKATVLAVREYYEDLVPVIVVFTVDFYGSLYQVICVQTGISIATIAVIMTIDLIITLKNQWRRHRAVKSLLRLLDVAADGVLPVVSCLCYDPRLFHGSSVANLVQLRSIRLYNSHPSVFLSPEGQQTLTMFANKGLFEATRGSGKRDAQSREELSRRQAITMPGILLHSFRWVEGSSAIAPASSPNTASLTATIFAQDKQHIVLLETTSLFFRIEHLLLVVFIECIIPLFYTVNLVQLWLSPNGVYFAHIRSVRTADDLSKALISITALFVLEVASFVLLCLMLRKQLRFSPLHQLSYVLEEHTTIVRANVLLILMLSSSFNLAHAQ